jgi:hypothetical protein
MFYQRSLIIKSHATNVILPKILHPLRTVLFPNNAYRNASSLRTQLCCSVGEVDDEPLRILYCGSDRFSCSTLQALHQESQRPSSNIASIDVVCREGKPHGRGLKELRHRMWPTRQKVIDSNVLAAEIKTVAKSLGLPVHQIKTFTGWEVCICWITKQYIVNSSSHLNISTQLSQRSIW